MLFKQKTITIATIFLMILSYSSFCVEQTEKEILVQDNSAFALDLYKTLCVSKGNIFYSPFSISAALAMTYAGARENTAKEIGQALHFTLEKPMLHPAFKNLSDRLAITANASGQKLNIANGLCLTGNDVSNEYKMLLKKNYNAEFFSGGLDIINGWVKEKTEGKINKILEHLSANSVCVLLNAIYFKGIWKNQFDKSATREDFFKVSSKKQVNIQMMYQKNSFKILVQKDFKAISLPYTGNNMSMIIFLPNLPNGLPELEKKINKDNLKYWLAELDKRYAYDIHLFFPKFKFKIGYNLIPQCTTLGIKDAFKEGIADFADMGWPKGKFWIDQIKHKTFIEVNEEGTEAAAATAVEFVQKSLDIIEDFRVDHPFIFLIKDNQTGCILFIGRVVDPTRTENKI